MKVRVWQLAFLSVLTIGVSGCDGADALESSTTLKATMAPADVVAGVTTTQSEPTTTTEGISTTSLAATTTSLAATPTTVAAVTTSSPPTEPPAVMLQGEGINDSKFGDDPQTVVAAFSVLLGPPDEDTGFIETQLLGFCGSVQQRSVRWGDLNIGFIDEPFAGHSGFVAYSVVGFVWDGVEFGLVDRPLSPVAATEAGVAVFDDLDRAEELYGSRLRVFDDQGESGFDRLAVLDLDGPWPVRLWLDEPSGQIITRIESNPCGE